MIENLWKEKIKKNNEPTYFNEMLVQIDGADFAQHIEDRDMAFIEELIDLFIKGAIIILKGVFEPTIDSEIKNLIWKFKINNPSFDATKFEIIEGCPDFWRKIDKPIGPPGGYTFIGNQFYFFRWNKYFPFDKFDDFWHLIKILSGGNPDIFKDNTPKDEIVDRALVNHYPIGTGHISPHRDPANNQKVAPALVLSRCGEDYEKGGFFVLDSNRNKRFFDNQIQAGDVVCWYPTIYHGADVPESKMPNDDVWNCIEGRWQMGLFSIDSSHKEKRSMAIT